MLCRLRSLGVRVAAAAAALCVAFAAPGAQARSLAEVPYTLAQTFSAALRYLRVDLGYEVTEKDADAAYLLFSYDPRDKKQSLRGSIEVVPREHGVRLFVSLPQLPSYHEEVLKQGLVRKLQAEYGEAVKGKREAPEGEKPKPPAPPAESDKEPSKPPPE
jgi:hypothetical protein